MPEKPVAKNRCGTKATGWLKSLHPTEKGQMVNGTVCFSFKDTDCYREKPVLVKNCGEFYAYYLEDIDGCSYRYCGE